MLVNLFLLMSFVLEISQKIQQLNPKIKMGKKLGNFQLKHCSKHEIYLEDLKTDYYIVTLSMLFSIVLTVCKLPGFEPLNDSMKARGMSYYQLFDFVQFLLCFFPFICNIENSNNYVKLLKLDNITVQGLAYSNYNTTRSSIY